MAPHRTIAIETLHQLLICDAGAGTLTWRERPREMFPTNRSWKAWNTKYAGKPALVTVDKEGYLCGGILGRSFLAHRVVWAMTHGEWPKNQIDHEFGNKADNVPSEMRDATQVQNGRNQKRYSTNTSGVTGVYLEVGRWRARAKVNGRMLNFGTYALKSDAIAARKMGETLHGFHPNHGRG
jgi:hypothetical protein